MVTENQVSTAISSALRGEEGVRIPEITQSKVEFTPTDYIAVGNAQDGTSKMLLSNLEAQISNGLNLNIPGQVATAVEGSLEDIRGDIADLNRKMRNLSRSDGLFATRAELYQVSGELKTYIDEHLEGHSEGDGGLQTVITNDPVLGDGTRNTSTEDPNRFGPVRLDEHSGVFFSWLTDRTLHLSDDEKRLFREGINAAEAPHDHEAFVERGEDFEDEFDLSVTRRQLVGNSYLTTVVGDMNDNISSFYSTKLYVKDATDALIQYIDSITGLGGGTVGSNGVSLTTFHNGISAAVNTVNLNVTNLSNSVYRTTRDMGSTISGLEDSISGLEIPTAFDPALLNQAISGIRNKVTGVSNAVVGENEISTAISNAVSGLSGVSTSVSPFNPTNLQRQITNNRIKVTNVSNALYDLSGDVGVISTSIKNSITTVSNRNRAYTRDQMGSVQTQVNDLNGELNTLSGAVSTNISQFNVVSNSLSQYATTGGVSTAVSNLSTAIINYIDGLNLTGSGTVGGQGVTLNQVQTLITNATTAVRTTIDGNTTRISNLEGSQITAAQVSTAITGGINPVSTALKNDYMARINALSFLTGVNSNTGIFEGFGTSAQPLGLRPGGVLLEHIGITTSTQRSDWREAIQAVSAQDVSGYVESVLPPDNRLKQTGGVSGQVEKKRSTTDYDTVWSDDDESSGGGGGNGDFDIRTALEFVPLNSPLSGGALRTKEGWQGNPWPENPPFVLDAGEFVIWPTTWTPRQKTTFLNNIGAEPLTLARQTIANVQEISGDLGSLNTRVEDVQSDGEIVSSAISNSIHSLSGNFLHTIESTQSGLESEITGLSSAVSNTIANIPRGGGSAPSDSQTTGNAISGERIGTWTWSTNKWSTFIPATGLTNFTPTGNSAGIVRFAKTDTGILDSKFLGFSIVSWSNTNRNNSDLISKSIITLSDLKAVRGGASVGRSVFVGSSNEELFVTIDDQSGQYQIKLDQTAFTGTVTGQILDLYPIFASEGHGIVTSVDSPLSIINGSLDIYASPWTNWVEALNEDKKNRLRIATGGRLRGVGDLPTIPSSPGADDVDYPRGDVWGVPHDDFYEVVDATDSAKAREGLTGKTVNNFGSGDTRNHRVDVDTIDESVNDDSMQLTAFKTKLQIDGPSLLGVGNVFTIKIGSKTYQLTDDGNPKTPGATDYTYSATTTTWAFQNTSDLANATISSRDKKIFPITSGKEWSPMGIGTESIIKSVDAPLKIDGNGRLDLPIDGAEDLDDIDDGDSVLFSGVNGELYVVSQELFKRKLGVGFEDNEVDRTHDYKLVTVEHSAPHQVRLRFDSTEGNWEGTWDIIESATGTPITGEFEYAPIGLTGTQDQRGIWFLATNAPPAQRSLSNLFENKTISKIEVRIGDNSAVEYTAVVDATIQNGFGIRSQGTLTANPTGLPASPSNGDTIDVAVNFIFADDTKAYPDKILQRTLSPDRIQIEEENLEDDSVTESKIKDASIGESKIKDDSIGASKIKDAAVEEAKIAADAVVAAKIADGTITLDKLAQAVAQRLFPAGGTTKQVVAKASDTDYAFGWEDQQGASLAVSDLISGPAIGLTVTDSAQRRWNNLTGFSPSFDTDDADKRHGVFEIEATIRMASASSVTIGFDSNTTNPLREKVLNGITFVQKIRATTAYTANSEEGVKIGEITIYNGSGVLGKLKLFLARDAQQRVGYYLTYEGQGGALNFSFEMDLNIAFLHNDGPGDASRVIPSPTDITIPTTAQVYFTSDGEMNQGASHPLTSVNTWSGWKRIYNATANTGKYLLAGVLNPNVNWTPSEGGDRAFTEVRFYSVLSGGGNANEFNCRGYIRNVPQLSGSSKMSIPISQILEFTSANEHYYLEARVMQQLQPIVTDHISFDEDDYLKLIKLGD